MGEGDRVDPGWRVADLEAARAEVPDAQNAALQVLTGKRLLPAGWFPSPPGTISTKLEDDLDRLPPNQRLDESQSKQLGAELGKAAAALSAARRVADMPRGRYVIMWTPNAIMTLVPHAQDAHEIHRLLRLDAVRRAELGDTDGVLTSSRALVNIGRSFGDEPTLVQLLMRTFCQKLATRSLERALAQGLASETALAEVQRLLEDEADQPLLLIGARGDRAMIHQFLEFVEAGGNSRVGLVSLTGLNDVDEFLDRGKAPGCHAPYWPYLTE